MARTGRPCPTGFIATGLLRSWRQRRFVAGSGGDPLFWGVEEASSMVLVVEAHKLKGL